MSEHERVVAYSLGYMITQRDLDDDTVFNRPMYVRCGWVYHRLHTAAHRFGFHDWLISRRWYRWWGEQRYGPTMLDVMASALVREIDEAIVARFVAEVAQ